MKKYLAIFWLAWKRVLAYKGVSFIYLTLTLLNYGLNLAVWSVAYQNPLSQPSAPFSIFIQYFTIVLIINQLVTSFTAGVIAEEHIKCGELSAYLLKPFPYFLYMLILETPWRLFAFFLSVPVMVILIFTFSKFIHIDAHTLLLTVGLIPIAYFLSFLVQIVFATLTFWFEDTHGTLAILEILTILFSGSAIPIFFFPPLLKTICAWLPFQYSGYFPIMVLVGQLSGTQTWFYFFALLAWVAVLSFVANLFWKNGLKKYTGEGI